MNNAFCSLLGFALPTCVFLLVSIDESWAVDRDEEFFDRVVLTEQKLNEKESGRIESKLHVRLRRFMAHG